MNKAKIANVVSFMPERIVNNNVLWEKLKETSNDDKLKDNAFFKGVEERRFASPDYSSAELGTNAVKKLLKSCQFAPDKIDLIICSCIFTDTYWPGIATDVQHNVGANNASIINVDTSCASFLSSLNVANAFIQSGKYNNIVVLTVTNFVSRLEEFQKSPRSFVLGDGAIAALVVPGKQSTIIESFERSYGENYGLMRFEPDLVEGHFHNYWERSCGPITVNFDRDMVEKIRENALKIVPIAVNKCLEMANLKKEDIDILITHQPNQMFLDEWRKRIGIFPPQTHDTLKKYGNLFAGSVAVTLADGIENNIIKNNDLVAIGTFSNGGDFASAMILKMDF